MKTTLKYSLAALSAAAALLCGCAVGSAAPAPAAQVPQDLPAARSAVPQAAPEESDPMLEKYVDVLEGVYYDHTLPDGRPLEVLEPGEDDFPNQFAIFDVDGDGGEELLLRYISAPASGQFGVVYGYDQSSGKLTTQLMDYCAMSFYPNGTVEVGWSHNQGLSGRFWPCSFYRYDADADVYLPVACADAWDREFFETDFNGNPFPADADPDGENIVYYVCPYGADELPDPISQREFFAWYEALIGFDPDLHTHLDFALSLPWQELNAENIEGLL